MAKEYRQPDQAPSGGVEHVSQKQYSAVPNKALAPANNKSFEGLSKAELYELAQEHDIEGRSEMTKKQLVAALEN